METKNYLKVMGGGSFRLEANLRVMIQISSFKERCGAFKGELGVAGRVRSA